MLASVGGDVYAGLPSDEKTKEQMMILSFKNSVSSTSVNEMEHIRSNFAAAKGKTLAKDLPVLLFAQADNPDFKSWVERHENQAASVDHGQITLLEGDHYLHHTLSKEIAHDTKRCSRAVHAASLWHQHDLAANVAG